MRDFRKDLWIICEKGDDQSQNKDERSERNREINVVLPGVCMQELKGYQAENPKQSINMLATTGSTDFIVSNALDYCSFKGIETYDYILWLIRNAFDLLLGENHITSPLQFFAVAEKRIKDIPDAYLVAIRNARKELRL
ncbi:MAG: hypothetical protein K6B69_02005 [Lachnospiraceae bacterium]|nr:hypothetical protein [Lachnospiraceae bacterium]